MSFVDLTDQIATELDNNVSSVGKVIKHPLPISEVASTNWPVCIIVPSNNENQFLNSDENLRTFAFDLYFLELGDQQSESSAYSSLRTTVDDVLDHFDKESVADLSGNAQWIEAVPSSWLSQETSGGKLAVMATVTIRAKVLYSTG